MKKNAITKGHHNLLAKISIVYLEFMLRGGRLGRKHLPQKYKEIFTQCLDRYNGKSTNIDSYNQDFKGFADWMMKEIKQLAKIN